jgi:hypothetical protein
MRSPFLAVWAERDRRAAVYGWLVMALLARGIFTEVNLYQLRHKEREVVRVGCDGIPQLVRVNDEVYSEPDEREIRAFAKEYTVFFMRADSYSIANDVVWCLKRMIPDLAEAYRQQMRATQEHEGVIGQIEKLHRRTQIDPSTLEVVVNKSTYPWRVEVKGARQIVSDNGQGEEKQPFELGIDLYRVSRDEIISGLVVGNVRPKGEALNNPKVNP